MLLLDRVLICIILRELYFSPILVSFTRDIHTPTDPIKALSIAHKFSASHLLREDHRQIKTGYMMTTEVYLIFCEWGWIVGPR